MFNEVQIIQVGLNFAREVEHMRKVIRFSAQRLDPHTWGVYVEGENRQGETLALKMRIDDTGALFKVP